MGLYARTKRWLRTNYPVPFPLVVYKRDASSKEMAGVAGWFIATEDGGGVIYISETIDAHMAETLLEEWAHALRHAMPIEVDYEGEPHDSLFWVTFGEITNEWRREFFKETGNVEGVYKRCSAKQ